jgi:hypothetical protein
VFLQSFPFRESNFRALIQSVNFGLLIRRPIRGNRYLIWHVVVTVA